jgi:hypothetical protein
MMSEDHAQSSDLSAAPLSAVQRWMQAVISHPDGVEIGLASPDARQHLPVVHDHIEEVIAPSLAQTSVERLAIYANAYYARLLECLGEEFPVLKQMLGDETFDAFAFAYLQSYPSRSYTLNKLGENFARFLHETRGEAYADDDADSETPAAPPPDDLIGWPDFLVDLATLEWTFTQVFDGPGMENEPPLSAEQIQAIAPERWPNCRLEMAPCFRLMALRFPVNAYYAAMRRGEKPDLPELAPSWLAVTRREYVVRRHDLTEQQFMLLSALAAGESVGAAIVAAAGVVASDRLDRFANQLSAWFTDWTAAGFFRAVKNS